MSEWKFGSDDFFISTKQTEEYDIFEAPEDFPEFEMCSNISAEKAISKSLDDARKIREKALGFLKDKEAQRSQNEFWLENEEEIYDEKDNKSKTVTIKKKDYDRLDSEHLKNKCDKIISLLNDDIKAYQTGADENDKKICFSDNERKIISDYLIVTKICILADEKDIADLEALKENLKDSYDKALVNKSVRKASRDMCRYLLKSGTSAVISTAFLLDKSNVKSKADDYASRTSDSISYYFRQFKKAAEQRKEFLQKKKDYKTIENNTKNLLKKGTELREIVGLIFEKMDYKLKSGNYSSGVFEEYPELLDKINTIGGDDMMNMSKEIH